MGDADYCCTLAVPFTDAPAWVLPTALPAWPAAALALLSALRVALFTRPVALSLAPLTPFMAWAEFAALYRQTHNAHLDHERAKSELKALMPADAKEAMGHGIRAKRSKSGALTFDHLDQEGAHAQVQ